jgi:hypothetical protein
MKFNLFSFLALATVLCGCSQTPPMGGAVDNDQNVLTGGPITGTTIQDLPQPVKDKLKQRMPHAEIASIVRTSRDGEVIYEISFIESGRNPRLYFSDDGKILPESQTTGRK